MMISSTDLEAMLQKRDKDVKELNSLKKEGSDPSPDQKVENKPQLFDEIVSEMNTFMKKHSDFNGVELDDEIRDPPSKSRLKMDSFLTPELIENEERLMKEEEDNLDDEQFLEFFRHRYGRKILGESSSDEEEFFDDERSLFVCLTSL